MKEKESPHTVIVENKQTDIQQFIAEQPFVRLLLDATPHLLFIITKIDGEIAYFNNGAERILGYKAADMAGRPIMEIVRLEAEIFQYGKNIGKKQGHTEYGLEKLIDKLAASTAEESEWVFMDSNNTPVIIHQYYTELICKDSKIGYMYIGYDVTEQKRIEEERKIIDRDLARYEKSMALTDMAAGIAHEINSPTAVILNDLQLLKLLAAEADDTNEKKKQKIISIINRDIETANRISSIVKAMKHSYRPGFWKTIDIISEIELQLTLLSKQMKGRVSIVRKYNMTAPVNSYGSEVGQVILNLLANAVESISGEGVIEIRVFEEEEGHVNVQIKDSGSGIPDEIASHIFEPFYTTKGEYGTGLGLSTSKAIMKKHNGSLELTKSLPGKGSIFTLILPIAKEVPHDL